MDKLPVHFRDKWSYLSSQVIDPSGHSFGTLTGDGRNVSANPQQGQTFTFANAALISYGSNLAPYLIYGDIYKHWTSLGGLNSGYGHPIADPQLLVDGSICSIFEGGHVHRPSGGSDVQPIPFPGRHCTAPHKPPVPTPLANGSRNWPIAFRDKWVWLSVWTDPDGKVLANLIGPADSWPRDWQGLTDNDNGGKMLHFRFGRLVSYDFTTPPFLVYGKIHNLWHDLGGVKSGLGHPLADPQILADGSTCSVFEGGHVHQIGNRDARIVPANECPAENKPSVPASVTNASSFWPLHFRKKWTSLSALEDPSGKQLASLLGPTDSWPHDWRGLTSDPTGGKTLHFRYGRLISLTFQSTPFLIYGKIFDLWRDLGKDNSGLGLPLADPQFLVDGSTCSIFQGGHVHQFGSNEPEIVPADECTAENKPTVSAALLAAHTNWPLQFRTKWMALSTNRDPTGKQFASLLGPSDCWPRDWPGLTDNRCGGKTLPFRFGRLISNTFQSLPILIYGKIFNLWNDLGGLDSGLGFPLADPCFVEDGSMCSVFEGGHVHVLGTGEPEFFPADKCENRATVQLIAQNISPYWPSLFRQKWTELSWQRDANGNQIGRILGPSDRWPHSWPGLTDNKEGGKTLYFRNGVLVSYDNNVSPYLVLGNIQKLWEKKGGTTSSLKYPLADPQYLPDGSICSIFEGGHIHQKNNATEATEFTGSDCSAPFQPASRTSAIGGPMAQSNVLPVLASVSSSPSDLGPAHFSQLPPAHASQLPPGYSGTSRMDDPNPASNDVPPVQPDLPPVPPDFGLSHFSQLQPAHTSQLPPAYSSTSEMGDPKPRPNEFPPIQTALPPAAPDLGPAHFSQFPPAHFSQRPPAHVSPFYSSQASGPPGPPGPPRPPGPPGPPFPSASPYPPFPSYPASPSSPSYPAAAPYMPGPQIPPRPNSIPQHTGFSPSYGRPPSHASSPAHGSSSGNSGLGKFLGRGMRMVGESINRMADSIDKRK